MTNGEILKTFYEKYPGIKEIDYRPLCPELYTHDLKGITIWLENGDVIQYYPKEAQSESGGSMSKEKRIQECENKQLIDELSKMPPMVIATAYLHALNYTMYGEDVTKAWVTAIQQHEVLEKAYRKGYYDALKRHAESEVKEW